MRLGLVPPLVVVLSLGGCMLERGGLGSVDGAPEDASGDAGPSVGDGGPDAGADAGPDASRDAGFDAGGPGDDAGLDAGMDAGSDAGLDAGLDAGFDAGPSCIPSACPGLRCTSPGGTCSHYISCAALHTAEPTLPSGVYEVYPAAASGPFDVYCEMVADGGGWTLLLKVDGRVRTFEYNSSLWESTILLNSTSLDMSQTEAKLRGFAEIPFGEMRVGLVAFPAASLTSWRSFSLTATSLRELFMRSSSATIALSRTEWLGMIAGSSIQRYCNQSETNQVNGGSWGRIRLGIEGNETMDCVNPDSFVGFGFCSYGDCRSSRVTTGNLSRYSSGGDRNIGAFGYVMVR